MVPNSMDDRRNSGVIQTVAVDYARIFFSGAGSDNYNYGSLGRGEIGEPETRYQPP